MTRTYDYIIPRYSAQGNRLFICHHLPPFDLIEPLASWSLHPIWSLGSFNILEMEFSPLKWVIVFQLQQQLSLTSDRQGVRHLPSLKLAVCTCQEAIPSGNYSSNHPFLGAVSFREGSPKSLHPGKQTWLAEKFTIWRCIVLLEMAIFQPVILVFFGFFRWCFLMHVLSSWWFQPIWKILVKLDHFPK